MVSERLAAWLDSYRAGLRGGLERAAEQGYRLVQANAAGSELDPREFSGSARRHLRKHVQDMGLRLDALALDYPGLGLADPAWASERVDQFRHLLELCADLRVPRAIVSLSGFEDQGTAPLARELLGVVADLADRFAIDASVSAAGGTPEVSARHVRALDCARLRVALDSAHLRPASAAVAKVAELVGTVYLRDVRHGADRFEEVPFGQGQVDFPSLLADLDAGHSDASLVIRRDGNGGVDALQQGREYIQSLMSRFGKR